ncbi:KaiC domain-containing protein [Salinigranum halophilum]|uniref:KaiC domain-containing protein n=1 Tax=Salinigranum halophilum TaxID=2565931 RepID=UPI00115D6354|nr:KaiC domain-containing protein [Salinigranum halophilum]
MSSDDDWFERAFADDETEDHSDEERRDEAGERAEPTEAVAESKEGADPEPSAPFAETETETETETEAEVDAGADSPFAEDFSDAFDSAPDPDAGLGGSSRNESAESGGPFGGVDGLAFGDADAGGFSTNEFDEAELDSQLDRVSIGIEGLDEMILGGIPTRSLITAIGSAGTGKTTIGMQFLNTALANDERAVYISLEESRQRVLDTAEEKGWEFRRYEREGSLAVVDLDPVEMANSLASIRNDLTRLISDFGAGRLVLDSVSLLEMMYDHPARRRSEVFQFTRALKEAGVTTLVTSEASDTDPFASRHGIIEYLADAVLILQYVRSNNFQETRLAIEIQKIRDANHSRQPKPYEITSDGISVHQQANLF